MVKSLSRRFSRKNSKNSFRKNSRRVSRRRNSRKSSRRNSRKVSRRNLRRSFKKPMKGGLRDPTLLRLPFNFGAERGQDFTCNLTTLKEEKEYQGEKKNSNRFKAYSSSKGDGKLKKLKSGENLKCLKVPNFFLNHKGKPMKDSKFDKDDLVLRWVPYGWDKIQLEILNTKVPNQYQEYRNYLERKNLDKKMLFHRQHHFWEHDLAQLLEMGVDESKAGEMLGINGGNVEQALQLLLAKRDSPLSTGGGPPLPAPPLPGGRGPPPAPPDTPLPTSRGPPPRPPVTHPRGEVYWEGSDSDSLQDANYDAEVIGMRKRERQRKGLLKERYNEIEPDANPAEAAMRAKVVAGASAHIVRVNSDDEIEM